MIRDDDGNEIKVDPITILLAHLSTQSTIAFANTYADGLDDALNDLLIHFFGPSILEVDSVNHHLRMSILAVLTVKWFSRLPKSDEEILQLYDKFFFATQNDLRANMKKLPKDKRGKDK